MTDEQPDVAAGFAAGLAVAGGRLPFAPDIARWDQHLLVDVAAVELLVEAAEVTRDDVVVDVGSGTGLISAVVAGGARRVLAVEIDRRFEPMLRELTQAAGNIDVYFGDFLDVDLADVRKVVANPPFGLLEPMLAKLVDAPAVQLIALVLGRSSAKGLAVRPGEPGFTRLALLVQSYYDVSFAADLPRTVFQPPPRVDASIVVLRRSERPSPAQRVLRILGRAAVFAAANRVRDVVTTISTRAVPMPERIRADQLHNAEIWGRRLQRLSNAELGTLAADLLRLTGTGEPDRD
jgi:16S rRNA (adenine1518-N6/adenine1519-N6)-dimethyltransferase